MIADCAWAPSNFHNVEGAEEWWQGEYGFALADRNYWKPDLME